MSRWLAKAIVWRLRHLPRRCTFNSCAWSSRWQQRLVLHGVLALLMAALWACLAHGLAMMRVMPLMTCTTPACTPTMVTMEAPRTMQMMMAVRW